MTNGAASALAVTEPLPEDPVERIHPAIMAWCWRQGWTSLRQVQQMTLQEIDYRNGVLPDAIISASTAAGKTEAAFLPILSRVAADLDAPGVQVLYIAPIKALINDQVPRLEAMGADIGLRAYPWHGDAATGGKSEVKRRPNGVLLITPESLESMLMRRPNDVARFFPELKAIVIDELHAFINDPRGVQLLSILNRIEQITRTSPPRFGLSATLADMQLAADFLRPGRGGEVKIISAPSDGRDLKLILKAEFDDEKGTGPSAVDKICKDAYQRLRGERNLLFGVSRGMVEIMGDRLTHACIADNVPNEFEVHHGSLSKDHRAHVEQRMRESDLPLTVLCTSTLEMGIDIGSVDSVGQSGAPVSVAGMKQRLGRSGRRGGKPAKLRVWVPLPALKKNSHPIDHMRFGLIRSIAMCELLLEGWTEPPRPGAIDLSTLLHQILSLICERHGISAKDAFKTLCLTGPFRDVKQSMFADLLRSMGKSKLLEQAADGSLLLGPAAETIVTDRSFFAVFKTPLDWTLYNEGHTIGNVPVDEQVMAPGLTIILAGRRWKVVHVEHHTRHVTVKPAKSGNPPKFGSEPGTIHRAIPQKMRALLAGNYMPRFLNEGAAEELIKVREIFNYLGPTPIQLMPWEGGTIIYHWDGTIEANTLALRLAKESGFDLETTPHAICILERGPGDVAKELKRIAAGDGLMTGLQLSQGAGDLVRGKFDPYIDQSLLAQAYAVSRLDESWRPDI